MKTKDKLALIYIFSFLSHHSCDCWKRRDSFFCDGRFGWVICGILIWRRNFWRLSGSKKSGIKQLESFLRIIKLLCSAKKDPLHPRHGHVFIKKFQFQVTKLQKRFLNFFSQKISLLSCHFMHKIHHPSKENNQKRWWK